MSVVERLALAQEFLAREAQLLDERRFKEWFDMLDDKIVYQVPIRIAKHAYEKELPPGAFRIDDDKSLIKIRVDRLESGAAWAEMPPSRTLRMVGSICTEQTDRPDVLAVQNALVIVRQRGHEEKPDVIGVRRCDELRITPDGVTLLRRFAILVEAALMTQNLGIFV